MSLFDRYKQSADKIIKSVFEEKQHILRHKLTGKVGEFLKEYKPTGKPLTTQIKLKSGEVYLAPSFEFEKEA
jgi:hypothetical protein